jgi:hypothetical protein
MVEAGQAVIVAPSSRLEIYYTQDTVNPAPYFIPELNVTMLPVSVCSSEI